MDLLYLCIYLSSPLLNRQVEPERFELAGRGCTIRDNVGYYVVELCNEVLCRYLLVSPPLRDALTTGLRNRWQTILLIVIISRRTPAAEISRFITIWTSTTAGFAEYQVLFGDKRAQEGPHTELLP